MDENGPAGPEARQSAAGKVQVTVYVPRRVAESARDAVVATGSYRRGYRSLSDLVADAVEEKVSRMAKQFNNGNPFPPRESDLKPGRPIGR